MSCWTETGRLRDPQLLGKKALVLDLSLSYCLTNIGVIFAGEFIHGSVKHDGKYYVKLDAINVHTWGCVNYILNKAYQEMQNFVRFEANQSTVKIWGYRKTRNAMYKMSFTGI